MIPGINVMTTDTLNAWRHLAAVARAHSRNPNLEADRYERTLSRVARGGDADRGGRGSDVALYAAEVIAGFAEQDGWLLYDQVVGEDETLHADALSAWHSVMAGNTALYRGLVSRMVKTNPAALTDLLRLLASVAAYADPQGMRRDGSLTIDGTVAGAWEAKPRQVPEWRRQLVARLEAPETAPTTAMELVNGRFVIHPYGETMLESAEWMCEGEVARLRTARLFHVDEDMSAVATRKASKPRKAPIARHRIPTRAGFLVFGEPVEFAPGYEPLVAASWERWEYDESRPLVIRSQSEENLFHPVERHDDGKAVWHVSLYTHSFGTPALRWAETAWVAEGQVFNDEPVYGSTDLALRAVIACWDLITQELVGKGVTDTVEEKRKPVKLRADRRRGITDDGTVRVVTVRGRRQGLPGPRTDEGATGRRYDRVRWWVEEHTRNHCKNTRLHADGGCTHEDITILEHPKGPDGAPFLETVRTLKAPTDRAANG